MNEKITAIEISCSGIKSVTGYVSDGNVYVLNSLISNPLKLNEDFLPDIESSKVVFESVLNKTKENLHDDLGELVIIIPAIEASINTFEATTYTAGTNAKISNQDYENAINILNRSLKLNNEKIVYDHVFKYKSDNKIELLSFPKDSVSTSLSIEADAMSLPIDLYSYFTNIYKELSLNPYLVLLSTYSSAFYINGIENRPQSYFGLEIDFDHTDLFYINGNRMLKTFYIKFGLNNIITKACTMLNLPFEQTAEMFVNFGFREEAGFSYVSKEGFTLKEISSTFNKAFSELLYELQGDLYEIDSTKQIPVILFGPSLQYENMVETICNGLQRSVSAFNNQQIGARNYSFINCLGAIKIADSENFTKRRQNNIDLGEFKRG